MSVPCAHHCTGTRLPHTWPFEAAEPRQSHLEGITLHIVVHATTVYYTDSALPRSHPLIYLKAPDCNNREASKPVQHEATHAPTSCRSRQDSETHACDSTPPHMSLKQ